MLTRRAANPAVPSARARRNPTVRDFRDRIRRGSGLLTHRPYPMSRRRCGEYPGKSLDYLDHRPVTGSHWPAAVR